MAEPHWTPRLVEERLDEAADTLKRLPEPPNPQTRTTAWPIILRDFWEVYGMEKPKLRLPPPRADAIDRMDETLIWLSWIDPDEARLVWWRATGVRWKTIEHRLGVSRQTAWRQWTCALITIAGILNGPVVKNVATKKPVTKSGGRPTPAP